MDSYTRKCYYQLRQLRVVSCSLAHQSTLALVHAFVTSRTQCCSSVLVGLPLGTLARLNRVLLLAVRLVGRLPKFASITAFMRDVLHWLPISQRIRYRITAMVSRCVLRYAPSYLCVNLNSFKHNEQDQLYQMDIQMSSQTHGSVVKPQRL